MHPDGRCYPCVIKAFGSGIVRRGRIDRKELAAIVFQDGKALKKLADIIHPQVSMEIKKRIEDYRQTGFRGVVVMEVPLLFESGFDRYADIAILVTARRQQQIARASKHLNISPAEAMRRLRMQMPLKDKIRLADMIIDNSRTKRQTQKQVDKIWQKLLQKRKK
jgi:dephospho-CoA kinase